MATTSNYIQWPTHRRKAVERRRNRNKIQRGQTSGKAPSNTNPNAHVMAETLLPKPVASLHQAETEKDD